MATQGKIDVWCNLFTEYGIKATFLNNSEVYFMMGQQWGRTGNMKWFTPEEFMARMDELGVEKVCIPSIKIGSYRERCLATDIPHEVVAELVQRWPDRFVGLAGINPVERMAGVRRMEKAIKEYGFKGAHVHPFGFGLPLNAAEWWPYYAKCEELDVPIFFQAGHSAEFLPSKCGQPILFDDVAIYFENLKLVGCHTGWPWCEEMIAMAWKHPNVYIGCSGHAPKYWDKNLVRFLNSRGIGKVMWGTDYPLILHQESIDQIKQLELKPEAEEHLFHLTARKVLKL